MLDPRDREALERARSGRDDPEPGWRDPKLAYSLMVAGVLLGVVEIVLGERPGAAAGFLLGGGLFSMIIQVPIARALWRCQRLIRHADEKKAFD